MSMFFKKKTDENELIKNKKKKPEMDLFLEQTEKSYTTVFCPESVDEKDLKLVRKNPEKYIEINVITITRMVDNFYISISNKYFYYKDKKYTIDQEKVYLLPTKYGYFMPTSFFKENNFQSKSFKRTNKGITGKALSLLYDENLYIDLFSTDEKKYNFFIVVFSLMTLILLVGGIYYLYILNKPEGIPSEPINFVSTIIFNFMRGLF